LVQLEKCLDSRNKTDGYDPPSGGEDPEGNNGYDCLVKNRRTHNRGPYDGPSRGKGYLKEQHRDAFLASGLCEIHSPACGANWEKFAR